ncbi:MAG TPA: hypothetical protein VMC08_02130 [Bacteroidales bacterium]|nr:hypothetical protein [Bacteroidales bacterium]
MVSIKDFSITAYGYFLEVLRIVSAISIVITILRLILAFVG